MNAQQALDEILKSVEESTGKPVLIRPDANLRTLASIRIARDGEAAHILVFQPKFQAELPYLASFQCGFALRMHRIRPEARFNLTSTPAGKSESRTLVVKQCRSSGQAMPQEVVEQVAGQLYDGLMLQLRSVPVGIRMESWLYESYPALRDMQSLALRRQLAENAGALAPQIRDFAPDKILHASLAMNAAFAAMAGQLLADETCVIPYRAAGHLKRGQELLDSCAEIPSDPQHDADMIRSWGSKLGLEGWFALVPLG